MKNQHFHKSESGVTLIEILISLTILVLVTGAISNGTNYLTRRLVRARNADIARNLAWQRLAEVKHKSIEPSHNSGIFGRDFSGYRFVEKIKPALINGRQIPNLFEYELEIYWLEAYNEDSIKLSTLIADHIQSEKAQPDTENSGAESE